jgi:hypothetical protein
MSETIAEVKGEVSTFPDFTTFSFKSLEYADVVGLGLKTRQSSVASITQPNSLAEPPFLTSSSKQLFHIAERLT